MRTLLLVLALMMATPAAAQETEAQTTARARIAQIEPLVATGSDPGLLFLLAGDYAEIGEREKAAAMLRRVIATRAGLYPPSDSPLLRYADDAAIKPLLDQLRQAQPSVRRARVAHVVATPGVVPEGLAHDPASGRLFLGDGAGRRILAIASDGRVREFARLETPPLGMKVRGGRLWVATTNAFWNAPTKRSEVVAFDLRSGRRVAAHTHAEAASFNDLDFAPNGDLFVSDSLGGRIYRLPAGGAALEPFTEPAKLGYPNGVAVSDDGRHLFVAHGAGPVRIDLQTRATAPLPRPADLSGLGIDGLYWRDGGLIGVQNIGTPGRVIRLELSPERDRISGWRLLEAGHPAFDMPTTGAPAAGRLFVIANAQLSRLGQDMKLSEPEQLKPIIILELPA